MKGRAYTRDEEQFLVALLERELRSAEHALKRHEMALRVREAGARVGKAMLACALVAGALTVAAVAPNAFGIVGNAFLQKRYFGKRQFEKELSLLKRGGYVHAEKTGRGYQVTLTKRGRKRALHDVDKHVTVKTTTPWDGTWWVVIFDIPRKHNAARNALRERLKNIGMITLQASVFISKYPCADEAWFVARMFSVERYVVIAHVDSLEGFGTQLEQITRK